MLAYLFWHRPAARADRAGYEQRLAAFHDRLREQPPSGFLGSAAFRVDVPWLGDGYEDWYLVSGWAALGEMNAVAVDSAHRGDHDAVAREAGVGTGGVYALRAGDLPLTEAGAAAWSAKPEGARYGEYERSLTDGRNAADFALWQRQMVLGPAPEFCLLTAGESVSRVA